MARVQWDEDIIPPATFHYDIEDGMLTAISNHIWRYQRENDHKGLSWFYMNEVLYALKPWFRKHEVVPVIVKRLGYKIKRIRTPEYKRTTVFVPNEWTRRHHCTEENRIRWGKPFDG